MPQERFFSERTGEQVVGEDVKEILEGITDIPKERGAEG